MTCKVCLAGLFHSIQMNQIEIVRIVMQEHLAIDNSYSVSVFNLGMLQVIIQEEEECAKLVDVA